LATLRNKVVFPDPGGPYNSVLDRSNKLDCKTAGTFTGSCVATRHVKPLIEPSKWCILANRSNGRVIHVPVRDVVCAISGDPDNVDAAIQSSVRASRSTGIIDTLQGGSFPEK